MTDGIHKALGLCRDRLTGLTSEEVAASIDGALVYIKGLEADNAALNEVVHDVREEHYDAEARGAARMLERVIQVFDDYGINQGRGILWAHFDSKYGVRSHDKASQGEELLSAVKTLGVPAAPVPAERLALRVAELEAVVRDAEKLLRGPNPGYATGLLRSVLKSG
jgi:hypothetical protein